VKSGKWKAGSIRVVGFGNRMIVLQTTKQHSESFDKEVFQEVENRKKDGKMQQTVKHQIPSFHYLLSLLDASH
jgi:hypothetical protein